MVPTNPTQIDASDQASKAFDHQSLLKQMVTSSGVYRMFGNDQNILYVGKAKNLKARLASYFAKQGLSIKTRSLVEKIATIEVTLTGSETEALILEQNLIKSLKPPYNILLRDDKSYPYIYLSKEHPFPSLAVKRVRTKGKVGQYFGPFPSAASVRESLSLLEKIFKVRQCEESFFNNRSRPCLQYQIHRCKAPCVGLVGEVEYQQDVQHVVMFLQGQSPELIRDLIAQMERAAANLEFEKAAQLRDQIGHLRHVQESQSAESGDVDVDVLGLSSGSGTIVVSMLSVRHGRILGHKNYLQKRRLELSAQEMLSAFVEQYYVGQGESHEVPKEVVLPAALPNEDIVCEAIQKVTGKTLKFSHKVKMIRAQWLKLAQTNADEALSAHLASKESMLHKMEALKVLLALDDIPKRMECFDISHSSGEKTVASCVVFNAAGALKSDYRSYNIEQIEPGDDYAAMRQALSRRYRSLKDNPAKRPDVIFIDGGKGQLNLALEVLNGLDLRDLKVVGIAKGATRKPGFETLLIPSERVSSGKEAGFEFINCPSDHAGLHLIQQIRDEAHRFAITGHRNRRDKARTKSALEQIAGIGAKRRRELLRYFGSVQVIKTVSIAEIAKVSGISRSLAEHIYHCLHDQGLHDQGLHDQGLHEHSLHED